MCSYAALTNPAIHSDSTSHPHSEPCCGSKFFAITKMQEEYGFDGYVQVLTGVEPVSLLLLLIFLPADVQTDCGAVSNMGAGKEGYAANSTDAATKAIVDGHVNSWCDNVQSICPAVQ